jgi:hypothetical protein
LKTTKRVEARRITKVVAALMTLYMAALAATGCGGGSATSTTSTSASKVQTYMMGPVAGDNIMQQLGTYTIDDNKKTFSQSNYSFSGTQEGAQLNYSGKFTTLSRGLLSLGITYAYGCTGSCSSSTGSWAIELADQAGGLVQLNVPSSSGTQQGFPFTPLVAANDCPNYSTAKTFQFVTLPAALITSSSLTYNRASYYAWDSLLDTAYGSVDIGGSGDTVNFNNIKQYTISGTLLTSYADLSGTPSAYSSITGACSQTFYGTNTISVPVSIAITDPGSSETTTTQALVGIGSSGLLVESNGNGQFESSGNSVSVEEFQPFLGAGTGAIGLPKPSSAIDTTALTGAQYLGFIYSGGVYSSVGSSSTTWSSTVASFGFSSQPSTCSSVATATSTMIYGGDFPSNDPSSATGGYGNCDVAIDLGTQDSANNGLFPSATVYLTKSYTANTAGTSYCFGALCPGSNPGTATAIAGQLNGKYAIFLIGVDKTTNQAWGIYLLQSN